jgi:NhaP-type Na+/H+ or K+/H+ antiporter
VLYAVLSLTVVRMVPSRWPRWAPALDRGTVLFVGWFGPRGLASLLFALLALEELGTPADEAVAVVARTVLLSVVARTVLLSVVAHGLTAAPLATRYGRLEGHRGPEPGRPVSEIPIRGLPRRRPAESP